MPNLGVINGISRQPQNLVDEAGNIIAGEAAAATGKNSIAEGTSSIASGTHSIALGAFSQALLGASSNSPGSVAIGSGINLITGPLANAQGAIAIGSSSGAAINGPRATGGNSVAIGSGDTGNTGAKATAARTVAIGRNAAASVADAVSYGADANAAALAATALGGGSYAGGTQSVAIGYSAVASTSCTNAIGIGYSSNAAADNSIALGYGASAIGTETVAIGRDAGTNANTAVALGWQAYAGHAGSTALGANATTTAINQIMMGTSTDQVVIPGTSRYASYQDLTEIAAPATPSTGLVRIYAKSDGHLYQKDDAGVETDLAATGGGTTIAQQISEPGSPAVGDLWLDTDEGAGVGLSSILAYAESITTQATITTEVDATGLSVSVTVPAGRRIRISARTEAAASAAGTGAFLLIKEGATELGRGAAIIDSAREATLIASTVITPTAGGHTYKVTLQAVGGNITTTSLSASPAHILVEDITGTLWPAGQSIGAGAIASEAWTDYTPTWTNVTLGNGVVSAAYQRIGRMVSYRVKLVFGSTTAFTSVPYFTLPITPHAYYQGQDNPIGYCRCADQGVITYHGSITWDFAVGLRCFPQVYNAASTYLSGSSVNTTTPFTWASTDTLWLTGTYEAAS